MQMSESLPSNSLSQMSRRAVVGVRVDCYATSNEFNIVDSLLIPEYKYLKVPGRIRHFEVFSHLRTWVFLLSFSVFKGQMT